MPSSTFFRLLTSPIPAKGDDLRQQSAIHTRLRYILSIFLVLFLSYFLVIDLAYAQDDKPAWQQNLTCDPDLQKYQDMEYCTGLNGQAHVIVIDLQSSGIHFDYVIAEGMDRNGNGPNECQDVNIPRWYTKGPGCYDPRNSEYYPVLSLYDAVDRFGDAAVIINSDYGAGTQNQPASRGHGPEGFTVLAGERIDGTNVGDTDNNAVRRPWLAVGNTPLRVELGHLTEDDGSKPGWVDTATGGGPWIIRDGEVATNDINNCTNCDPHSCASSVAQTAVGLSNDGRWMFLVAVVGENARGTAEFMDSQLETGQAIKFDGGGSTQLWYGDIESEDPYDKVIYRGDGRWLSQYLAVYAQPGSGIIHPGTPELPSPEPPDAGLNIFQRIWKAITGGVDKFVRWVKELVANAIDQAQRSLENAKRKLVEDIQRQLVQKLKELCGAAWLPGLAVAGIWFLRRRRNRI